VNACEVKAHLIICWQYLGAVCFWQPIPFGLNLVVVAVLRDNAILLIVRYYSISELAPCWKKKKKKTVCVVSLLPCIADCYYVV